MTRRSRRILRRWARRVGLGLAGPGVAVALTGCSSWQQGAQTAGTAIEAACALGLLKSEAVQAEADRLGVPKGVLADLICRIPELVDAFEQAKLARTVDPGVSVLAEARARGTL